MQISDLQISQVNHQIQSLRKAKSFYGKKLEETGITGISAPEDFEKLVLAYDNSVRKDSPYRVREQDTEAIDNGRYRYPALVFEQKKPKQ